MSIDILISSYLFLFIQMMIIIMKPKDYNNHVTPTGKAEMR